MQRFLIAGMALLFLTGCLSVEYQGKNYQPTTDVKIYENKEKIPFDYATIGKCRVAGDYNKYSQEDVYAALIKKAKEEGADAILIYAYQIVAAGSESERSQDYMSVWSDSTNEVSGWNQLQKDFGGGYGEIGKDKSKETYSNTYNRIVRAWFLKYYKNIPPSDKKDTAAENKPDTAALPAFPEPKKDSAAAAAPKTDVTAPAGQPASVAPAK
jgi:hypothetical protein